MIKLITLRIAIAVSHAALLWSGTVDASVGARDTSADLAISLTATPNRVAVGAHLKFVAVLSNRGPDAVAEVAIRMRLPIGTTLVSATLDNESGAAACRLMGGEVECTAYAGLGATTTSTPRTATIIVAVGPAAGSSITTTATAQPVFLFVPPPPPPDPDFSNNSSTVSVEVGHEVVGVPGPGRSALILLGLAIFGAAAVRRA